MDDIGNGTFFKNVTVYSPALPITTVGCTFQYQFCDPSNGSNSTCTDLSALKPVWKQARSLFKREKQKILLSRMREVISIHSTFTHLISKLKHNILQINQYGFPEMAGLKDDYWITELSHMMGTLMKLYQIRNYRYTGGYNAPLNYKPNITAPLANETWMCDAQLVKREDYQSISVLGMALILSIGTLIILINLTLDSIVGWYQKRYNRRIFASLEWEMLGAETLQRELYEAHGVDLRKGRVSMGAVLERLKVRRNGETMDTLVEKGAAKESRSVSSSGTLGQESEGGVSVERVDTGGTVPGSPVSRRG
jgi:hypothetical protein